jgi:alpha-glucosidase
MDRLPLYVRAGAAIPTQAVVQHTGESGAQPIVWLAYLGDGAEGDLYEDDGESMEYANGAFVRTHLSVQLTGREPEIRFLRTGKHASPRPAARVEIVGGFPSSS